MISYKKWSKLFLSFVVILLVGLGTITIVIDPYFHYHAPLKFLEYPINNDNERYQNDGIVKHFNYDAIITGTSMTQNFKSSEFDRLFGVNAIKVPFPGASYKEINENLERAVEANSSIQIVLRGLDYNRLGDSKDDMRYSPDCYPTYLYDDRICNDVYYILNKDILINGTYQVIRYTQSGKKTTDFDAYGNWMRGKIFGKDAVDKQYTRRKKKDMDIELTKEDYQNLHEHLRQNITELVEKNPQIDFYLFFTPYSIYYWDRYNQIGTLKRQLALEEETIRILLQYDNIYLFSFFDEFEMICDLDNYKDPSHYGENVNSQILLWMYNKEHLLTQENYKNYCDKVYDFYTTYDYDSLFETFE